MYKLAIIGGMGPMATVEFYKRIILNTPATSDNEHINIIVLNHSTMPDRTYCIENNKKDLFLEEIRKDFELLNKTDVQAIAIPCNTAHYFYDYFNDFTDIPVINMVDHTIKQIKNLGYKSACLFSTTGTYNSGVYHNYAQKHGIEIVELEDEFKKDIMEIIYNIKKTNNLESSLFNEIIEKKCSEKTVGIIACTELSLIELNSNLKSKTIDALDVLVNESLSFCGYKK